jgi:glutamate synthase (NADPH/NADH) large chain
VKDAQGEKAAISLLDRQQAFGYTQEDLKFLMAPMAVLGEEATGSMGNDSPLAVMSNKLKPLYSYFKQLFAQVTNPPIDPIREAMVMSLVSFIGPKPNLLDTNNVNPPMRLEVSQPVLGFDDMARLRSISLHTGGKFKSYELNICYPVSWGKEGIEASLASLCAEAVDAVKSGHNILIVSDRNLGDQVAIPALLATSAIHQHLVQRGLRASTGLVVETGSAARRTTSRCWPATAPKPCTRTWRWKRWSTWRTRCRTKWRPTRRSTTTPRQSARAS